MRSVTTGSQTVGPFFRIGLEHLFAEDESAQGKGAETVRIRGRVIDGEGSGVPDAMLEVWHANREGRYCAEEPDSTGRSASFTRVATGADGSFSFCIPRPGPIVHAHQLLQAPHISVLVFARGLMRHLMTRMYLPDDAANRSDPILQSVALERRGTLIAKPDVNEPGTLEWNVVLQGDNETVFFAW